MTPSRARPLSAERLLYCDEELCVVDKPSGVLSQDAPGREDEVPLLARTAALLARRGEPAELYAVHRLDEETTGTVVLARQATVRRQLEDMFRDHTIERIYHAVVIGRLSPPRGRLEGRLREDDDGVVHAVTHGGKPAITDYASVAELPGATVVACRLATGRRNQIRVQFADLAHPLIGDRKYGRNHPEFTRIRAPRALLHATAVAFAHPTRDHRVQVVATLPADFVALLGRERAARLVATLRA